MAPTTLLAQAPIERFISTPERPEIYRDSWIDKTAQMATLYGFPRVLKDERNTRGCR